MRSISCRGRKHRKASESEPEITARLSSCRSSKTALMHSREFPGSEEAAAAAASYVADARSLRSSCGTCGAIARLISSGANCSLRKSTPWAKARRSVSSADWRSGSRAASTAGNASVKISAPPPAQRRYCASCPTTRPFLLMVAAVAKFPRRCESSATTGATSPAEPRRSASA
eukprot:6191029-Pleurochrysis_carterae.AAC.5